MPTLAQKITATKASIVEVANKAAAIQAKLEALDEGAEPDAADVAALDQLDEDEKKFKAALLTFEKAEGILARAALPAGVDGSGTNPGAPALALSGAMKAKPSPKLFVRSAIAAFEFHHTHQPLEDIIERRWPNSLDLQESAKLITAVGKAAQNPAMTNVPAWAGALVRESWAAFMDLLGTEAIIPQIPMQRYTFEGGAPIKIPVRVDDWANQHLGAGFRKEGAPIRVGAAKLSSMSLAPYSMGVIGTFTMEMLRRSQIDFESAVERWMREDTARVMDTAFLDNNALVADTRPAGLQNGLPAGDTAASTGNDSDQILADLRGRIQSMANQGLGRNPYWLMHPSRAAGAAMATNAVGDLAFPSMANNILAGIPVRTSLYVPLDVVFLVDASEIAFAGGNPEFSYSEEATIHEDSGLPFTANAVTANTVLPIASGAAGAGVVATPARSLWQTYSGGIRSVWDASWAKLRAGAVQTITGVAW
ncbi:MAG: phage major capsid protein [Cystobacter sp.]